MQTFENSKMKQLLSVKSLMPLLVLLTLFVFAGCDQAEKVEEQVEQPVVEQPVVEEQVEQPVVETTTPAMTDGSSNQEQTAVVVEAPVEK